MSQAVPPVPPFPGYLPLTTGQTLDRIFRLFRDHFLVFLRIACVPAAFLFVMYGIVGAALFAFGALPKPSHPPDPFRLFAVLVPTGLVAGLAFALAYAIFEAAETYAGLQANLGIKVSFREAYGVAFQHAGRFLWVMVLRYLWIGGPILVCYLLIAGLILGFMSRGANPSPSMIFLIFPLLFLAYLGAMVYAVIMGLRLALALPACVAEGVTGASALRRSLVLTTNAKGRIFVVMLVVYAAGYVAFMALEAVCFAVVGGGALLGSAMHVQLSNPVAVIGAGLVVLCLFAAMFLWMAALAASYAIGFAVLYQDQRFRIEGVPPVATAGEPT